MATKSRKKKSRSSNTPKPPRASEVRQYLTQKLFAAVLPSLGRLLDQEPGNRHVELVRDAFVALDQALTTGTFAPEDAARHADLVDAIMMQVNADRAAEAADVPPTEAVAALGPLAQSLRNSLANDLIDDPAMIENLADRAVGVVTIRKRLPNAVAAEVLAVSDALADVEAGRDDAALQAVAKIGFRSVMSPWRLLIRGMVAFYQSDLDAAETAWRRLPRHRTPRGIARAMLATADRVLEDQPMPDPRALDPLRGAGRDPGTHLRDNLRNQFRCDDLEQAASTLRKMEKSGLVPADWIDLARDRVYALLMDANNEKVVRRVINALGPRTYDHQGTVPAIIARMLSGDPTRSVSVAKIEFEKFFQQFRSKESLSVSDRAAIEAAIGLQVIHLLCGLLDLVLGRQTPSAEAEAARITIAKAAGEFLVDLVTRCAELSPQWDLPMDAMSQLDLDEMVSHEKLDRLHEIRCAARPEDMTVLRAAVDAKISRRSYDHALPLVEKLIAVAPRDDVNRALFWHVGLCTYQSLTAAKQCEAAEAMIDRMRDHRPDRSEPGFVPLFRGVVRYQAGQIESAEACFDEAKRAGLNPLALTYIAQINAIRADLPPALKKRFADQRKAMLKTVTLADLTAVSDAVANAIVDQSRNYAGRVGHLNEIITLAKRVIKATPKKQWTAKDVNSLGVLVVRTNDDVLRRAFRRYVPFEFRHFHVVSLCHAIEEPSSASYHLHDVVHGDAVAPEALPKELASLAKAFYKQAQRADEFEYDDDEPFDDDDDDESFGLDPMQVQAALDQLPPEMLALYRADPRGMEEGMREYMPAQLAGPILARLKAIVDAEAQTKSKSKSKSRRR